MPIVPITYQQFHDKRFKRVGEYAHAEDDLIAPVVLKEIPRVVMEMPVGFAPTKDGYLPVAVLSFGSPGNAFVSADGRWQGNYIPAHFRGYPFCLGKTNQLKKVLCIDDKSASIIWGGAGAGGLGADDGEPFFLGDGSPSDWMGRVLHFLEALEVNRQQTQVACQLLASMGLFKPWSVKAQTPDGPKEQALTGLFGIDPRALGAVNSQDLAKLRDQGALLLVYAHLLSAQHLVDLATRAQTAQVAPAVAGLPIALDDMALTFDGLEPGA